MIACLSITATILSAAKPQTEANLESQLDKGHETNSEAASTSPSGIAPPVESEGLALAKDCNKWFGPSISLYEKAHKQMYVQNYANAVVQFTNALAANRSEMRQDDHLSKSATLLKWGCCKRIQAHIYECRGYCLLQEKKYKQGIDDLTKAITFHTTANRRNYMNRGRAYSAIGEDELAAADFEMVQMLK
jgi:tetratricopeptide (TPR) repeat protein